MDWNIAIRSYLLDTYSGRLQRIQRPATRQFRSGPRIVRLVCRPCGVANKPGLSSAYSVYTLIGMRTASPGLTLYVYPAAKSFGSA